MTRIVRHWRGFCVVCRRDLWTDPLRHYISRSHRERVEAADRRRDRLEAAASRKPRVRA